MIACISALATVRVSIKSAKVSRTDITCEIIDINSQV